VISCVAHRFIFDGTFDAVYGDLIYVDAEDTNRIIRYWKSGAYRDGAFRRGWMPPHPSLFVKRKVYERYGVFDTRFNSAADYEFMLRVIHKGKIKISYLNNILVKMRSGGKSNASLRNRIRGNREDHLAWKINGISPCLFTLYLKPLRKLLQYIARP
jgi:glycosyltransferase